MSHFRALSHLRARFRPTVTLSCIAAACWIVAHPMSLQAVPQQAVPQQAVPQQAALLQAEGNKPAEIFQDQIGVEIINIDVTVIDKKGHAVEGLAREDFKLEIDGKEVPIANFHALSSTSIPANVPESLEEIADVAAADSARPTLHIVVYVESFYLLPNSRQRVLRDLPTFFAEQVAAGAKIMVMEHHRQSRVLAPFTDDLSQLQAALEEIKESPAAGIIHQRVSRRAVMTDIQSIYNGCNDPCNDCFNRMVSTVDQYSNASGHERRAVMASLGNVVNALAVLEGKKAVLHVSDGIQQQAGLDVFDYLVDKLCPQKRLEATEYLLRTDVGDLNKVVAQANASRVTFYTLEAAGLRGFSSASVDYATQLFIPSGQNDMLRFSNLQGTLTFLASETGGKAILNANKFSPALAKLTGELKTYYSLGYQTTHVGEGRSHRVKVKVPKNKAVDQVRYRRRFLHKQPEHLLADKAMGAVMFGVSENALGAVVSTKTDGPAGVGPAPVVLEVSVPYENLVLIPRDKLMEGRLKLILTVPDPQGKVAIRKMDIPISIPAAEARGDLHFGVNLKLEAGEHHLGVSLWDEFAATGSFLSLPNPISLELAAGPGPPVTSGRGRKDGR